MVLLSLSEPRRNYLNYQNEMQTVYLVLGMMIQSNLCNRNIIWIPSRFRRLFNAATTKTHKHLYHKYSNIMKRPSLSTFPLGHLRVNDIIPLQLNGSKGSLKRKSCPNYEQTPFLFTNDRMSIKYAI